MTNASAWAAWPTSGPGQQEPELIDDRKQIIDPHTAYQMTSILEGVVQRGTATVAEGARTGRSPARPAPPTRKRTPGSSAIRRTWWSAYYVGYDTPKPMGKGNTGGAIAAPIFGDFMKDRAGR